ncbi:MAG: hypothetical protein ACON3Z_05870 [Bradymonadia bacterium]
MKSQRTALRILCGSLLFGLSTWPILAASQGQSGSRAPKEIQIDAVTVEGKVQKPEAFFFLQRSKLNFDGLEPKKSFLPLIIKSVDKPPF